MKRAFSVVAVIALALVACQQTPPPQPQFQPRALGTLELRFDLDARTVQVQRERFSPQAVRTASDLSFTAPTALQLIADAVNGVNYLSATFKVNNLTGSALSDLTLIAYHKTGNAADTALKDVADFNGTPLTEAQLAAFAQAVQPVNMPTSLTPSFAVNDSIADLQYLRESELPVVQAAAQSAGEMGTGEYLFPYGFVARARTASRVLPTGNSAGTVTLAVKLPNTNEPGPRNVRRFSMTLIAVDEPLGVGVQRLTQSYEERRGTSSAAARASYFGIAAGNIASNTVGTLPSGVLVNGVRTAGSVNAVQRILGERAWQLGTSNVERAQAVAVDASGNVFIAGYTAGDLDGNTSAGDYDAFIAKYDASGTKLWTRLLGTSSDDRAYAVGVDASGNAFIAGYTQGVLDGSTNAGLSDAFVAKYDANGTKLWARQLGSGDYDQAYGVALDSSGNAFIAGLTLGDLDGNINSGFSDAFIAKYDANGTKLWTRQLGTNDFDQAFGVALDSSGKVFVAGYTSGNLDGNASAGIADAFVAKYDSNGTKLWTRQLGSRGNEQAYGVAVDASGNAFIAGYTSGNLDGNFNVGFNDAFVAKYDANGTKLWTRQLGTSSNDQAYAVGVDASGNAFVAGYTQGSLDGNASAGSSDAFITKYDASGVKQWTRQLGTSGTDQAFGVAVDGSGHMFIAGYTSGGFAGVANAGSNDIFLARLDVLTNLYK